MTILNDEHTVGTRYTTALRANWALIVGVVVVSVGVTAAFLLAASKRYEAKADLFVNPIASSEDTFLGISVIRDSAGDPNRSTITAARFVKTPRVAEAVRSQLAASGMRLSTSELDSVQALPVGQANIVSISAESGNPSRAAKIANAFASETIAQRTLEMQGQLKGVIASLSSRLAAIPAGQRNGAEAAGIGARLASLEPLVGRPDPTLTIMTNASPPVSPVSPRPKLTLAIGFLAALLLGMGLAIVRELVSPNVTDEDELIFGQRLPVLTRIPRLSERQIHAFLANRTPALGELRESFRTLRANLAFGDNGTFPRTILVTSAISGEGKTLAAANLAITIAAGGERVLLIDGDLRRPMLATVFGVPSGGSGLTDVLLGKVHHGQAVVPAPGHPHLRLLLSSVRDADLVDLIEPAHDERVLEELKEDADVIIIDSSPLTEVADALKWAGAADAILVTVRIGWSRRDKLEALRRTLGQRGLDPAGFVLTTKERPRKSEYYRRAAPDLRKLQAIVRPESSDLEGGAPGLNEVEHG
jgi:capsular exopolysaccharide synthesis family protein